MPLRTRLIISHFYNFTSPFYLHIFTREVRNAFAAFLHSIFYLFPACFSNPIMPELLAFKYAVVLKTTEHSISFVNSELIFFYFSPPALLLKNPLFLHLTGTFLHFSPWYFFTKLRGVFLQIQRSVLLAFIRKYPYNKHIRKRF